MRAANRFSPPTFAYTPSPFSTPTNHIASYSLMKRTTCTAQPSQNRHEKLNRATTLQWSKVMLSSRGSGLSTFYLYTLPSHESNVVTNSNKNANSRAIKQMDGACCLLQVHLWSELTFRHAQATPQSMRNFVTTPPLVPPELIPHPTNETPLKVLKPNS